MRRKRLPRDLSDEETPINLTPLIDVVFVVLIMFILIAPMLELDRVELAQGPSSKEKEMAIVQDSSPVAIHVRADNSIWFGNKKVSAEDLLPLLKVAKQKYPKRTPQLFHDKKAHFGTYQSVKNALEGAGYDAIDIILQPS